ncbi:MAG: hypothetical protein WD379_01260 [Dehalococcoidia bacterium]
MNRLLLAVIFLPALLLAACETASEPLPASPTTEPTASATATALPTPTVTSRAGINMRQLAYAGADMELWLVNADGSGRRLLTRECPSVSLAWAPDGDMIACTYFSIAVFDLQGRVVWGTEDTTVWSAVWSPDGQRLVYQAGDESLRIVDLASQSDELLHVKALPLEWPREDRLLVGLNPIQGQLFQTWEANWLNPETGALDRVPRLDNVTIWPLPGGERAILLGSDGLAMFDIETSEETTIAALNLQFPTEGLPPYAISVSANGELVYAADASSQPTVIYRVVIDSGEIREIGTVPGVLLNISPEGIVAYLAYGGIPETLHLANLTTGQTIEVGLAQSHLAWRPIP